MRARRFPRGCGAALIVVVALVTLSASVAHTQAQGPKRGGTFRLGVSGGSSKDFIDGQNIVTRPDQARIVTGWPR